MTSLASFHGEPHQVAMRSDTTSFLARLTPGTTMSTASRLASIAAALETLRAALARLGGP